MHLHGERRPLNLVAFSFFQLNSGSDVWRAARDASRVKGGSATETNMQRLYHGRPPGAGRSRGDATPQAAAATPACHDGCRPPRSRAAAEAVLGKDPFARPPLQLEPTDEQLGSPPAARRSRSRRRPCETSWAIVDAGAPGRATSRHHARASIEDMNSKEGNRRDIEPRSGNEDRKAAERRQGVARMRRTTPASHGGRPRCGESRTRSCSSGAASGRAGPRGPPRGPGSRGADNNTGYANWRSRGGAGLARRRRPERQRRPGGQPHLGPAVVPYWRRPLAGRRSPSGPQRGPNQLSPTALRLPGLTADRGAVPVPGGPHHPRRAPPLVSRL